MLVRMWVDLLLVFKVQAIQEITDLPHSASKSGRLFDTSSQSPRLSRNQTCLVILCHRLMNNQHNHLTIFNQFGKRACFPLVLVLSCASFTCLCTVLYSTNVTQVTVLLQSYFWPEPLGASNRTSDQDVCSISTIQCQYVPWHFSQLDSSTETCYFQSDLLRYTKAPWQQRVFCSRVIGIIHCRIQFIIS